MKIEVNEIRFHAASSLDAEDGLLGWATFVLNGAIRVDGVAVRKTRDGRHTLSFPARQAHGRRRHFWFRPLTDDARREIEHQVFRALNLEVAP